MDKGKIVRLVLIPIIIGLVVTLIVRQMLAAPADQQATTDVEMVSVVTVATQEPIRARTKLTEQHLTVKEVPASILTGSEFTQVKDVVGQITLVSLEPGEVVRRSRVVPEGQGTLPYRIPEGHRAMTIRIDELSGVAGHLEPGDLVDLVLYLPAKDPQRPEATTQMLYESILVLGVGPKGGNQGGQDGPRLTSVTLALKPAAAVQVALAEQIGYIKLLLRPALDEPNVGRIRFGESGF